MYSSPSGIFLLGWGFLSDKNPSGNQVVPEALFLFATVNSTPTRRETIITKATTLIRISTKFVGGLGSGLGGFPPAGI